MGSLCKHSKFPILGTQGITSRTDYTWMEGPLLADDANVNFYLAEHTEAWTKQQMC